MPSESFYVAIGICGLAFIIFSAVANVAVLDYQGTSTLRFIAPYALTIGIMFFVALGVAGYLDLKPRFRRWNLKRKSKDIDLEKQERELEKKKREFETKYPKENQTKSASTTPNTSNKKQTTETPLQKRDVLPKQTTKPMETKPDGAILETNKPVTEFLKHKERETKTVKDKKETTFTDADYLKIINDSLELKSLWNLLHAPANRFQTVNLLYESLHEEADHRKQHNKACDMLAEFGLIIKHDLKYSWNKKNEYYTPLLSERGKELIKRARDEKVTSWKEFEEKYLSDSPLVESTEKESVNTVVTTPAKKTECSLELNNAMFHFTSKDFRKAIEVYDQVLKKEPDNLTALVGKANSLHSLGKYDDALSSYNKALALEPNNEAAKIGKEQLLSQYDNNKEAKKLVEKGISLYLLNEYGKAVEYYDKALELDPSNIRALICKGDVVCKVKPENAIYWYDAALDIDPKNVTALVKKAVAVQNLRSSHEAERILDDALEIDPNHVGALVCKANIVGEEDNDKALELLDKALSIDPKNAFALESRRLALQMKSAEDEISELKRQLDE